MLYKKITRLLFILFVSIQCVFAQNEKVKTYQGNKYSIQYPEKWQTSSDKAGMNFFPAENNGGVTVSVRSAVNLTATKTKEIIIKATGSKEKADKVKATKKADVTVYDYEYEASGIKWVTEAFRKNNDLFIVTIYCDDIYWDANKDAFLKVLHSFKLNAAGKG